jgi:hypothetical protein
MTEDYLHYIWKFGKFNSLNLSTSDGQPIEIVAKGVHNHNAGPDFLEAKIKIGQALWVGHVEIHVKSSDFNAHKHQFDEAYNTVVLHVVFDHDEEVKLKNGSVLPTLVVKDYISTGHFERYKRFVAHKAPIVCAAQFNDVPDFIVSSWWDRMAFERLERKTSILVTELKELKGDWEEVFYRHLLRYFGMKVNGLAMSDLAHLLPFSIVRKEASSLLSVEALFFGQAGMLNDIDATDTYESKLRGEYLYLKQKYQLYSMKAEQWRFSKMRPPNFPTMRLAQLAVLFSTNQHLFQCIKDKLPANEFRILLDIAPSDYWKSHYTFGNLSKSKTSCKVGEMLVNNILINVIVPVAFAYGQSVGDDGYKQYALDLLKEIPKEKNSIVGQWIELGVNASSAMDTQASIELYTNYCSHKKCLQCQIGVHLLNNHG